MCNNFLKCFHLQDVLAKFFFIHLWVSFCVCTYMEQPGKTLKVKWATTSMIVINKLETSITGIPWYTQSWTFTYFSIPDLILHSNLTICIVRDNYSIPPVTLKFFCSLAIYVPICLFVVDYHSDIEKTVKLIIVQ